MLYLVLTGILLSVKRLRSPLLLEAGVSTAAARLGSSSSAHGLLRLILLKQPRLCIFAGLRVWAGDKLTPAILSCLQFGG
jgi:hypothetical protein